jgi:hypothetical protein
MEMTIIAYRSCNDIDIQFADGTIVLHKYYQSFVKGQVTNPNLPHPRSKKNIYLGKVNTANNGLKMTIVAYRSATDLDVLFENGELVEHRAYGEFKRGKVGCPNYGKYANKRYIGKINMAKNGQKMTVLDSDGHENLTVQFEDGTVVDHVSSSRFFAGSVYNPNYTSNQHRYGSQYIGMSRRAKNGLMMTVAAYRSHRDIDVRFEDGTLVTHKLLHCFLDGSIKHPDINAALIDCTGESCLAKCGINMSVANYTTSEDIDVLFETGCMVSHRQLANFRTGRIGHPFPYQLGLVSMDKVAYIYNGTGNFYCHCTKCGLHDIMTIQEMKLHKCIAK